MTTAEHNTQTREYMRAVRDERRQALAQLHAERILSMTLNNNSYEEQAKSIANYLLMTCQFKKGKI